MKKKSLSKKKEKGFEALIFPQAKRKGNLKKLYLEVFKK
jgi:hypothetical protein